MLFSLLFKVKTTVVIKIYKTAVFQSNLIVVSELIVVFVNLCLS